MPHIKELNHSSQLKRVGFGRPPPRHGLQLLYWFCTECLYFNETDKMVQECDPSHNDFGFHRFENRSDQNGKRLLPYIKFPYYVVGNLNSARADELPDDVSQVHIGYYDNSNIDRIIVSLKYGCFDKVYITEHIDESNYDPNKTYRIDKKVIKYIRRQTRSDFLNDMSLQTTVRVPQRQECYITINSSTKQKPPTSRGFWDYCTIL